ncbi:MAG: hypothetical protein ACE5G8_06455 [Anaerolineae bacterium]
MQHTPATNYSTSVQTESPAPAINRLTVEVVLYGALALLALGLRLFHLGNTPLNDAEAAQALAALDIFRGAPAPGGLYSPLAATLNSFTFLLFNPSDWGVRLAPALLGSALVVLPFGLRRQLGRAGALAASALLALSATTLFWSRTAAGDIAAAVGMLLLVVGGVNWAAEDWPHGLNVVAVGLVLLVLGAPVGYTALASLALLLAIIGLTDRAGAARLQERLSAAGPALRRAGALFGGLLLLLATAASFNLTGLGAASEVFSLWLAQFGLQPQPGADAPVILMLVFYEPLIVLFGVIGLIAAVWNRRPFEWLLAAWAALVILLDFFMAGRSGGQMLAAVVPLALLAGKQIGWLAEAWQARARLDAEGIYLAIGLIVSAFVYISFASWSKCTPAQAGCQTAWVLPLAGVLLLAGLAIIFWVWYGPQLTWRGVGMVLLVTVGIFSMGAAWRLSFGPPEEAPFQPMVQLPPSTRLPVLLNDLARLSAERVGDDRLIDIAVVKINSPMLRWYLRRFDRVRFEDDFVSAGDASIILARPDAGPPPAGAYVGQEFALVSHWSPNLLQGKDWLRWYMYRTLPNHLPGSDQVVMWVRVDNQ